MAGSKDTVRPQHKAPEVEQKSRTVFVNLEDELARPEDDVVEASLDIEEAITPTPFVPLPITRSGLYSYTRKIVFPPVPIPIRDPIPIPQPGPRLPQLAESDLQETIYDEDINAIALYQREEARVDVDGRYPQMTISGTRFGFLTVAAHWIASVTKTGPGKYEGPIWYKDGAPNGVPHTHISAVVTGGFFPATRKLEITFSGGGAASFKRTYAFESSYHHKVEFEYDTVQGATAVTSIQTHDHPNRPASLPSETLSLETVYRRAGFGVSMSGGNNIIPISGAGGNATWSDQEMHDAMQQHWSRFANKPQWALWVLFASLHDIGTNLGGIMFDDIGPNHRQGTAIFSDAFIANPPPGDPAPAAWVKRMRFWTAAHEMGHAFNLAHSWQKAADPNLPGNPWIPLQNDLEARSFMNYPYYVNGGQSAFFADFTFRFVDPELLFMRHAPSRFVQMGNAAWFTNHGFEQAAMQQTSDYELRLSTNMAGGRFPYLTPPVVEAALVNRGARAKLVSGERLSERPSLMLIINPERGEPRRWLPHLRHCGEGDEVLLQPGDALYDSIMIGTGRNGWDMADPGRYTVQAVLTIDDQTIYSNQVVLTVEHPASREEERLAADFFTPEVGQVLGVNGTRALGQVNNVLENALELRDNPVSKVAAVALATPLSQAYKVLEIGGAAGMAEGAMQPAQEIKVYGPDPAQARRILREASEDGTADDLVNAIGHARYLREAPKLAAATERTDSEATLDRTTAALREGTAVEALELSGTLQATLKHKASTLSH